MAAERTHGDGFRRRRACCGLVGNGIGRRPVTRAVATTLGNHRTRGGDSREGREVRRPCTSFSSAASMAAALDMVPSPVMERRRSEVGDVEELTALLRLRVIEGWCLADEGAGQRACSRRRRRLSPSTEKKKGRTSECTIASAESRGARLSTK